MTSADEVMTGKSVQHDCDGQCYDVVTAALQCAQHTGYGKYVNSDEDCRGRISFTLSENKCKPAQAIEQSVDVWRGSSTREQTAQCIHPVLTACMEGL
ncbi:hypothetical protein BaRGS_00009608 [Batillaria attramentaria]|uniref:Uncharacterized protein n=1 Tax=Batillaria attramentaria TaxID=370345 RepID=A0ABD0LHT2_9CAEN